MTGWVGAVVGLALAAGLTVPGAWVALRRGALRGVIASVGAGLLYELLAVLVMIAWNLKDYGVAFRPPDFGFGFGLLLAQAFLGLFWAPLQMLAVIAASWRRRRSGVVAPVATPSAGAARVSAGAFLVAAVGLAGLDAVFAGWAIAAGPACDARAPALFVLCAYPAILLFVLSAFLTPDRRRALAFAGLLAMGAAASFGCLAIFGDAASRGIM